MPDYIETCACERPGTAYREWTAAAVFYTTIENAAARGGFWSAAGFLPWTHFFVGFSRFSGYRLDSSGLRLLALINFPLTRFYLRFTISENFSENNSISVNQKCQRNNVRLVTAVFL